MASSPQELLWRMPSVDPGYYIQQLLHLSMYCLLVTGPFVYSYAAGSQLFLHYSSAFNLVAYTVWGMRFVDGWRNKEMQTAYYWDKCLLMRLAISGFPIAVCFILLRGVSMRRCEEEEFTMQVLVRGGMRMRVSKGMNGYLEREMNRPGFKGDKRHDQGMRSIDLANNIFNVPLQITRDGKETFYPEHKRKLTIWLISTPVITVIICAAMALYYLIHFMMAEYTGENIAGAVSVVFIMIFDELYTELATKLNDLENYRTDTDYDNAMILKLFTFQFLNNFGPLYVMLFMPFSKENAKLLYPSLNEDAEDYVIG
eukprot:gene5749-6941_t